MSTKLFPKCPEALDPSNPEHVATLEAVRRVVRDWDGLNWSTIFHVLRDHGRPAEEIRDYGLGDVRQAFALGQTAMTVRIGGQAETSTCSIIRLDPPEPSLHRDELKILQALANAPAARTQYDLTADTGLDRKTVGKRLEDLRQRGLTCRPHGAHGGEALTAAGRALI